MLKSIQLIKKKIVIFLKQQHDAKPLTLVGKTILVFGGYICLILVYGVAYQIIYENDPTAFSFNSDIREKNIREQVSLFAKEIKENSNFKPDTIVVNKSIGIVKHSLQYIAGKDTVTIQDTNHIPQKALEILLLYEKNSIKGLWNPLDFIYFSMITISTVGYGDILPNSTVVRMVVVSQILFGQILLVFVLANVISNITGTKKTSEKTSGVKEQKNI